MSAHLISVLHQTTAPGAPPPKKSLPISHWSPAKAKRPPLHHDEL